MDAVIFDMDGLLIDSEPFWKQAEKNVFSSLGVDVDTKGSTLTASMTTEAVTQYWYTRSPWQGKSLKTVENDVVNQVSLLIQTKGKLMAGALPLLDQLRHNQVKIGLATNSPRALLQCVIETFKLHHFFNVTTSSNEVSLGKPDPAIYLKTLEKLNARPQHSIGIEDSVTGMTAAKRAGMKCIVVPAEENSNNPKFMLADLQTNSLSTLNYAALFSCVRQPLKDG